MRTLPHTDIPHSVEYLHGGPKPESGLQQRYNKVVFKVSLYELCYNYLPYKPVVEVANKRNAL